MGRNQTAGRGRDATIADYVSNLPPDSYSRMVKQPDPQQSLMRKGAYAVWAIMAVAAVAMVQINDFGM